MQTYGAATLAVSCFPSVKTTAARVEMMTLSDLYQRLQQPYTDTITGAEFKALSKDEQGRHKDAAGAYMLGEYTAGTRAAAKHKQSKIEYRSALALDLDDLPVQGRKNSIDIWAEVQARLDTLECSYLIHETRKSTAEKPRLRVIIPLDRTCSADMYSALAHAIGGCVLNPTWVDSASAVPAQVMFWPTISSDQAYRVEGDLNVEKPPMDVDKVLDNYYVNAPWTEADKWVQLGSETGSRRKKSTKDRAAKEAEQADPFKKGGVIGAFCRMFPVDKCIDAFLSGGDASDQHREIMGADQYPRCYEPAGGDRFTYLGRETTTTGGAVAYNDFRFLYSYHGTDPYSQELMNSFNLIQRHIFGHLDDGTDPDTKERDLPSFKAAIRFAAAAEGVQVESFSFDAAAEDAGAENVDPATGEVLDQPAEAGAENTDWVKPLWNMLDLSTDIWGHTKPRSTINNFLLILQHDGNIAGKIRYNMFTQRIEIQGRLPKVDVNEDGKSITAFEGPRETPVLRDADEATLRNYVEHRYGISAKEKLKDGIILAAEYNRFHPARDYFNSLPEWDGVERVPYLLTDYLGAEDTPALREVMTKHMLATVTRVFHGGVQYDTMIVLTGRQGLGKSTFIRNLAGSEWFTDNVGDLTDTDSLQEMQGHIFVEFGELDALRKSEVTTIKRFVTRRNDSFRVPYGRNQEDHPRQCVFWGSTNKAEYLRDQTGNRRFACIDCLGGGSKEQPRLSVFTDLPKDRDQIWAEAMAMYRENEDLYWHGDGLAYSKETAEALEGIAEEHRDADPREATILEYCLKPIPSDWSEWTQRDRQEYYTGTRTARFGFPAENQKYVQREYVCVMGIWVEALGGDVNRMTRTDKDLITGTLNREAWLKPMQYRDDRYGRPRGWKIVGHPDDDKE